MFKTAMSAYFSNVTFQLFLNKAAVVQKQGLSSVDTRMTAYR